MGQVLHESTHAALVAVQVGLRSTRAYGEVLTADGDMPAVARAQSAHIARREPADVPACSIADREAGELPDLGERIGGLGDPFPDRHASLRVLTLDPLRSAQTVRHLVMLVQLLQRRLPGERHRSTST